jgi:hypothetical protein
MAYSKAKIEKAVVIKHLLVSGHSKKETCQVLPIWMIVL